MEVKVDSNLIRSERENRGWTQGHLATIAGLSLRTIQRIEKTGSASFESVTALASVLSVEIADLRANESEPSREGPRAIRLSLELPVRLALAVVSGVLCALQFRWNFYAGWPDVGFGWLDFGIAGALFGVTVLCPYLRLDHGFVMRALGLIGASALSYFCAVMTASNADAWLPIAPVLTSYLLAGVAGVTVVLVAARILIPLRVTAGFWFLGLAAGLFGGAAMYAGFEVLGDTTLTTVVGYCGWHLLVCLAIYRGCQSNDAQSGWLAAFARTRGRFSIVPGWVNLSHRISVLTSIVDRLDPCSPRATAVMTSRDARVRSVHPG
jgi:transcriptional regulator with XRE-family HTH domain